MILNLTDLFNIATTPTSTSEQIAKIFPYLQRIRVSNKQYYKLANLIAANPNTPPYMLAFIFPECCNEVLQNPSLELLIMENQYFIDELFQGNCSIPKQLDLNLINEAHPIITYLLQKANQKPEFKEQIYFIQACKDSLLSSKHDYLLFQI